MFKPNQFNRMAREMKENTPKTDVQQNIALKGLRQSVSNQAEFGRRNINVTWSQNG